MVDTLAFRCPQMWSHWQHSCSWLVFLRAIPAISQVLLPGHPWCKGLLVEVWVAVPWQSSCAWFGLAAWCARCTTVHWPCCGWREPPASYCVHWLHHLHPQPCSSALTVSLRAQTDPHMQKWHTMSRTSASWLPHANATRFATASGPSMVSRNVAFTTPRLFVRRQLYQ